MEKRRGTVRGTIQYGCAVAKAGCDVKYVSVCDGIGAIHVATLAMGWRCLWTSEIDTFPTAVVEHHWHLPNLGDMLTITESEIGRYERPDLLVGGTPCQSFSVAGLRRGLADARGNLALRFIQLAAIMRPRWVLWENVPGVLSSGKGRDFGAIVGALAKLGYGWAYRILDAQYWGVAQRRRRVFLVGCLGGSTSAGAVLFERESLLRNYPTRDKPGQGFTRDVAASLRAGGAGTSRVGDTRGQDKIVAVSNGEGSNGLPFLTKSNLGKHVNNQTPLVCTLRGDDKAATLTKRNDSSPCVDRGMTVIGYRTSGNCNVMEQGNKTASIGRQSDPNEHLIVFDAQQITCPTNRSAPEPGGTCHTLAKSASPPHVAGGYTVRRLTPRECERLQGFPDDYTAITWYQCCGLRFAENLGQYGCLKCEGSKAAKLQHAKDTPRYAAIGNSMAVPVIRWICERIETVDSRAGQRIRPAKLLPGGGL